MIKVEFSKYFLIKKYQPVQILKILHGICSGWLLSYSQPFCCKNRRNDMNTNNGDFCYDSTGSALLEFFSKAGSLFKNKTSYYGNEASAIDLFKSAWSTNNYKSMKLAMWARDCRGGAGNRSGFRDIINWVANKDSRWVESNLHLIPFVGRWDDLESLINTPCENQALSFWARAIQEGNQLAAKWAPREDKNKDVFNRLRKIAKMSPKEFRKLLVKNTNVVESSMCENEWSEIDFNKVPSVAMARYNKAFKKHDAARFDEWKGALEKGVDDNGNIVKVNASVLFPHDIIRSINANYNSDHKLENAQFAALPNYMEGTDMRIMPICDFSGSMCTSVSGSIQAIDVSMGLGLYCSDKVGEKNPFYRKLIPFSDNSKLVDWKKYSFSQAAKEVNNGFCGSTNIASALNQILSAAKMFNATNDQIPNCLLILSDMQFDQGLDDSDGTVVEKCMKKWEDEGYNRPRIIYWNLAGYAGSPSTKMHENVALVSGFSPSILKAVLGGEDFTPMAILDRAIEKYEVIDPNNPDVPEKVEKVKKAEKKVKKDKKVDINDEYNKKYGDDEPKIRGKVSSSKNNSKRRI